MAASGKFRKENRRAYVCRRSGASDNNLPHIYDMRKQVCNSGWVRHRGMDSSRAKELYMKYGGYGPLKERATLYNMSYLLKQSPSYRAVVTPDARPQTWWDQVWSSLEFFNEFVDEIHWKKRLSEPLPLVSVLGYGHRRHIPVVFLPWRSVSAAEFERTRGL